MIIIAALAVVFVLSKSLRVVPAGSAFVIERLGRYRATVNAGLHVLAPFIDRIAFRFSLQPKEQELVDTAITHDNVPIAITTRVTWQIVDAERAAYATANVENFVLELVRMETRRWISGQPADDVRMTTRELQSAVLRGVDDAVKGVGASVTQLEVREVRRAS